VSERIRVAGVEDIPAGEARRFDAGRHRICIVRIGDDFYAIGDQCSHEDYSLSEGDVFVDEREIECWKHGTTFSLETGEPLSLPATKAVPTYNVVIEGADVIVEVA